MSDTQDLVAIPEDGALDIFSKPEAAGLEPFLKIVREKVAAFVPDLSTAKGRKEIASMAYKVARSSTLIDDAGKKVVADLKELPKQIDKNRKAARDELEALKLQVRQPLDDYEAKEEQRVAKHVAAIDAIDSVTMIAENDYSISANALNALMITKLVVRDEDREEFTDEYTIAIKRASLAISSAIKRAERREADAAELAQLRADAAERDAKERAEEEARRVVGERQRAAEAAQRQEAERAAAEAERQRKAVEEAARVEREAGERRELALRLEIEKTQREAAEAEAMRRREAQEAADRAAEAEHQAVAETARREADIAHRTQVNHAAVAALMEGGLTEEGARLVVTLIAKRLIPGISIFY